MNIIIERLDGTQYSLADYNISVRDFIVDSPSPRFYWETVENRDGVIDLGTDYDGRTLRGSFFMSANDFLDFPLLRNEIFKIFASKEPFYLIDDREPGKRWYIKANTFSLKQVITLGEFDIEFFSPSAYAESVKPTSYTFTTTSFRVYNAGDITIDPRVLPLKITFTGASTNLTITNETTGDTWQYTGTTVGGDTITLDGVRSLKNGASIFGNTNRQLITIATGWNDFSVVGTTGAFEISFNFHFYYL
jgi:Phage tail protein